MPLFDIMVLLEMITFTVIFSDLYYVWIEPTDDHIPVDAYAQD